MFFTLQNKLVTLLTAGPARSLDENLHTRQGPVRTFLILARYASRTVYEEQVEKLNGSMLWPSNVIAFFRAFGAYIRVELKLGAYERLLQIRAALGMVQMAA